MQIQDCDGISNGLQDLSSKEEGSDNLAVLGDRLSMQITNSSNFEKSTLLPEVMHHINIELNLLYGFSLPRHELLSRW